MYKVISFFTDLQDNDHPYEVGDTFPHEGVSASAKRIAELTGSDNQQKKPLIHEIPEEKKIRKKV